MQNFYFSRNTRLPQSFLHSGHESCVNKDSNGILMCSSLPEYKNVYKNQHITIYSFGVFVYKDKVGLDALVSFSSDIQLSRDFGSILRSSCARGQYFLIVYAKDSVYFITDKFGYYPVYLYKSGDRIALSNSFMMLAKNNIVSISEVGVAQYLSENLKGYACCESNIANEISYLKGGTIYTAHKNNFHEKRYYDLRDEVEIGKYSCPEEVSQKAEYILKDSLSFLRNVPRKIYADLTGGIDTRVNFSMLSDLILDVQYATQIPLEYEHYTNTGPYSEHVILKEISKTFKFDFYVCGDDFYLQNKKHIEDIAFLMSNKQTYNRRAGYFIDLVERQPGILVSGLSGTEIHRQPYLKYFQQHDTVDWNDFVREHYPVLDIMLPGKLDKHDYFESILEFFKENLDGVEYKHAKDLGSYIDYFSFYRTHFCRYYSLANSILPFYSSYADPGYMKLLLETQFDAKSRFSIQRRMLSRANLRLAEINSTRGFPLSVINENNIDKFSHLLVDDIPQQYISPEMLKKNDEMKACIENYFLDRDSYYKMLSDKKTQVSQKLNLLHECNDISIVKFLDDTLKSNLPVFDYVDKDKLKKRVESDCNFNVINRVLNLNRMLEEISFSKPIGGSSESSAGICTTS